MLSIGIYMGWACVGILEGKLAKY